MRVGANPTPVPARRPFEAAHQLMLADTPRACGASRSNRPHQSRQLFGRGPVLRGYLLLVLLVACSHSPALPERYQALLEAGQPQQILKEYSRPELVRQAPALFPYHANFGKLNLYCDEPFPPEQGAAILAEVKRRLSASTLYRPDDTHSAFVCNERWREEYYLNGAGKLGGLNYFPTQPSSVPPAAA